MTLVDLLISYTDWLVHQAFSVLLTGHKCHSVRIMYLGLLPPCFNALQRAPAYSSTIQQFNAGQAEVLTTLLACRGH